MVLHPLAFRFEPNEGLLILRIGADHDTLLADLTFMAVATPPP
jgi:hypothetical protein